MSWRRDIVSLGRLLAVTIIVLGIVVAVWNATDLSEVRRTGSYPALRGFISESLDYLWAGALVLIVTEIVGAVGNDRLDLPPRIKWTVPEATVGIAGILILIGTVVTVWDIRELNSPGFSDSIRYFLREAVFQYLWHSALLIALAALADYLSARNGEARWDEEASLVVTEP